MPTTTLDNINPSQIAVLRAVKDGPKETSNKTNGSKVSGVAAKALAGLGLVKVADKKGVPTKLVTITGKGTKHLAKLDK